MSSSKAYFPYPRLGMGGGGEFYMPQAKADIHSSGYLLCPLTLPQIMPKWLSNLQNNFVLFFKKKGDFLKNKVTN